MIDYADRMTESDRKAWEAVEAWKAKRLHSTPRRIVPESVRRKASTAGEKVRDRAASLPGADQIAAVFVRALSGLTDTAARVGSATVRTEAVLKAYRKRGYDVATLADVRTLDQRVIRQTKQRLDLAYISASMAQGAGTGLLASGGTMLAVGGAVGSGGVAAAPGAGAAVAAIATDAAATIVASNRAIAHIAAYYGYDVEEPGERLFALGVLSVGLAAEGGKALAYRELNGLVQALARRQTWKQLQRNQVARVVDAVYRSLGMRLTQRRLGTAVPIVGVAVGAGLSARTLARVVDDADHVYLERHLREKYGLPIGVGSAAGDMIDIIDTEIVDGDDDLGSGHLAPTG